MGNYACSNADGCTGWTDPGDNSDKCATPLSASQNCDHPYAQHLAVP